MLLFKKEFKEAIEEWAEQDYDCNEPGNLVDCILRDMIAAGGGKTEGKDVAGLIVQALLKKTIERGILKGDITIAAGLEPIHIHPDAEETYKADLHLATRLQAALSPKIDLDGGACFIHTKDFMKGGHMTFFLSLDERDHEQVPYDEVQEV